MGIYMRKVYLSLSLRIKVFLLQSFLGKYVGMSTLRIPLLTIKPCLIDFWNTTASGHSNIFS